MSKICWIGKENTLETVLIKLGHSKQKIKKIGLSKKERARIIKQNSELYLPGLLFNTGIINPFYSGCHNPEVLEKRGAFLALHKPSHIHIHPLCYSEGDNLLSFLRSQNYFSYIQNFSNTSLWDGGLLYRLDFETSGLVILTNNQEHYDKARNCREVGVKEYLVIVEGAYDGPLGEVEHYLSTSGKRVYEDKAKGSKSHIFIELLCIGENESLLKVTLRQGRRHQIRLQLSLLGFPIFGDSLYGAKKDENSRFGLHCYHYELSNGMKFYDDKFWGLDYLNFNLLS